MGVDGSPAIFAAVQLASRLLAADKDTYRAPLRCYNERLGHFCTKPLVAAARFSAAAEACTSGRRQVLPLLPRQRTLDTARDLCRPERQRAEFARLESTRHA